MRINMLDRSAFSNVYSASHSRNTNRAKENNFETEMFDSALIRLKAAYEENDAATMKQTIDILLDFARVDH